MGEDDILFWQDALDELMAGRSRLPKCPFCQEGEIEVTRSARLTRLECRACHRYVEGRFAEEVAG